MLLDRPQLARGAQDVGGGNRVVRRRTYSPTRRYFRLRPVDAPETALNAVQQSAAGEPMGYAHGDLDVSFSTTNWERSGWRNESNLFEIISIKKMPVLGSKPVHPIPCNGRGTSAARSCTTVIVNIGAKTENFNFNKLSALDADDPLCG
jgi:hypothetical protein